MTKEEKIIESLEEQIANLEGVKHHSNARLDDAIERLKKLRFDLKYGKITT